MTMTEAITSFRDRLRANRGLASEIAELLGIERTSVWMWKKRVPAEHVIKVAKFLRVSRHSLRPDLYPPR